MTESSESLPPLDKLRFSAQELEKERLQLQGCRRGFLLLGSGLLLVYLLPAFLIQISEIPVEARRDYPTSYMTATFCLTLALAYPFPLLFSGVALDWRARSQRWRLGARLLASIALGQMALLIILGTCRLFLPQILGAEPFWFRLCFGMLMLLQWGLLWSIVLVLSEFAELTRAEALAEYSELLSMVIVVGALVTMAWLGWYLPMPPELNDPVRYTLDLITTLIEFVVIGWVLLLVSYAATIARLLADRYGLVREKILQDQTRQQSEQSG